jgi:circadian clock protein KaiC
MQKNNFELIKSGNPLVDATWGGYFKGGTYLLIGPPKSGKTILALQFALKARSNEDTSLYISTSKLNDLIINSSAINIDLQHHMDEGLFTLTKINLRKKSEQTSDSRSNVINYFNDLRNLLISFSPGRVVFDELSPFLSLKNFKLFSELFLDTKIYLQDRGITTLYLSRVTEIPELYNLISSLQKLSTANIVLTSKVIPVNKLNPGTMQIGSNIGFHQGKFSCKYFIEAGRGVDIELPRTAESNNISSEN